MVQPPGRASRWWSIPLAALGLLALGVVAVAGVVPASSFADKAIDAEPGGAREATPFARVPAGAESVNARVSFGDLPDAAERYATSNDFFFVTVSEPPQSALSWFVGHEEESVRFLTETEKYGTASPSERRRISQQLMATSEQISQYVALDRAGYDVELVRGDVVVGEVLCLEGDRAACTRAAPADRVLEVGDVLLEVDGDQIENVDDLGGTLEDRQPGDVVGVRLRRGERTQRVDVELISSKSVPAAQDEPERTLIGFVPVDTLSVELPFEVDIDTGAIGGPSAGVAFTLSLLDDLTPGDLTPGEDVAITGTINVDGSIGAIGGLPQKVEAVKQAGLDVFLVPASQSDLDEATRVAGDDVELIPVATLDDALEALERLGADPVPARN